MSSKSTRKPVKSEKKTPIKIKTEKIELSSDEDSPQKKVEVKPSSKQRKSSEKNVKNPSPEKKGEKRIVTKKKLIHPKKEEKKVKSEERINVSSKSPNIKSIKKEEKLIKKSPKKSLKSKSKKGSLTPKKERVKDKSKKKPIIKREVVKSKKKSPGKKIISAKKIEEEESETSEKKSSNKNEESAEEEEHKTTLKKKKPQAPSQFSYNESQVTKEIESIFKKIADKKKSKTEKKFLGRKHKKEAAKKTSVNKGKNTAKDFNYDLQKNPNQKVKHSIDLEKLFKEQIIFASDIVLAIIEIGFNSEYYLFGYSTRSKMFWEDILKYKILGKIFEGYKSETLRKYWRILSSFDFEKIKDLIVKNKKFLDNIPIKLGTIVLTVEKFLLGKIDNFEQYIKDILVDVRKQEIFEEEYHEPGSDKIIKVKNVLTITTKRKKYEPGHLKKFIPKNGSVTHTDTSNLNEIYNENKKLTDYQNTLIKLQSEEKDKLNYLQEFTTEEKKKLHMINEDDKFIFKTIDNVLDNLCKDFSNYPREFILNVLISNSMNIVTTYICLANPSQKHLYSFSEIDDDIILNHKGSDQYKSLIKEKGSELVKEREKFLTE
jgi:chemotaxis protein histidine kinase CheA